MSPFSKAQVIIRHDSMVGNFEKTKKPERLGRVDKAKVFFAHARFLWSRVILRGESIVRRLGEKELTENSTLPMRNPVFVSHCRRLGRYFVMAARFALLACW